MWLKTRSGTVFYKRLTFPDGQPHISVFPPRPGDEIVTIETAIRTPAELFDLLMVLDVLGAQGYESVNLDIRYLMGARMDRAIDANQPATLRIVTNILHSIGGINRLRVLDPHSEVALQHLNGAVAVYPTKAIRMMLRDADPERTVIIVPDKGARDRVMRLMRDYPQYPILQASKERDSQTGRLSGFALQADADVTDRNCIIVDDICDGGGTFSGLGELLRKMGASRVDLFVTHGIFSKGLPLPHVSHVWTTDSYYSPRHVGVSMIPILMSTNDDVGA